MTAINARKKITMGHGAVLPDRLCGAFEFCPFELPLFM
jgi:hypothetical protein